MQTLYISSEREREKESAIEVLRVGGYSQSHDLYHIEAGRYLLVTLSLSLSAQVHIHTYMCVCVCNYMYKYVLEFMYI